MSRAVCCMLLVLLLAAQHVCAGGLEWAGQFRLAYDDNPFQYSPSDLDRFRLQVEPARFPIRTSDDLDVHTLAGVTWRYRLLGGNGDMAMRGRMHSYLSNWEKSYAVASWELGQTPWPGSRFSISYTYLPSFLLRYFRDPGSTDTTDFLPCRFAEHLGAFELRQQIGPVEVAPGYGYEYDDYSPAFDYYDSRAHRPGIDIDWQVARSLAVGVDYELKLSSASGPLPDISHRQHRVAVGVRTHPLRMDRFSVDAGYSFASREFTTANSGESDPAHAGRVDQIERVNLGMRYRFGRAALVVEYGFEWRHASSPYRSDIEEVKDYRQNRVGLGLVVNSGKGR